MWVKIPMAFRVLIVSVLLLTVLIGSAYGMHELSLRVADHMTVTIIQTFPPGPSPTVFHQTFGRSLAEQMEGLLNDRTSAPKVDPGGVIGTGEHPTWEYHFTFTLKGVVLESAWAEYQMEPELYSVSALGIADGQKIGWNLIPALCADSHGAIPLPPVQTS